MSIRRISARPLSVFEVMAFPGEFRIKVQISTATMKLESIETAVPVEGEDEAGISSKLTAASAELSELRRALILPASPTHPGDRPDISFGGGTSLSDHDRNLLAEWYRASHAHSDESGSYKN